MPSDHVYLSNALNLLSRIWIKEVDAELFSAIQNGPLSQGWIQVGGHLDVLNETTEEALATDYCRLFVGPSPSLPPYQSVWEFGQLGSESTSSMQRYISLLTDTPTSWDGVLEDHVGIQLGLFAMLFQQGREAAGATESISELRAAFSQSHLVWITRYLDVGLECCDSPFYKNVFGVTKSLLDVTLNEVDREQSQGRGQT